MPLCQFLSQYNSSGVMQWTQSPQCSIGLDILSQFNAIAIDSSRNLYVVGTITCTAAETIDFGNGVTGPGPSGAVLVKYDSSGKAQWYQSLPINSADAVAVDASAGSIYVGGSGGYAGGELLKYSAAGGLQWTQFANMDGNINSFFYFISLGVDASGNVYAFGQGNSTSLKFGNGIQVGGGTALVRYTSSGQAEWAQSTSAPGFGRGGIAVSGNGDVYLASQAGLAKFNASGATLDSVSGAGSFSSVALDSSGNVFASGAAYLDSPPGDSPGKI